MIRTRATGETDWLRALLIPLTILAWLALAIVGTWLLGHVMKTVLTLILSTVIAFALTPLVNFFARRMPRGVAIALAYLIGFAVIFGFGALLVVTAADQITSLVGNLPRYRTQFHNHEPQLVRLLHPFGVTTAKLNLLQSRVSGYVASVGTAAARDSLAIVSSVLGAVVDTVLVLILSVYLTANGTRISSKLRRETPLGQRRHTTLLIAIVNQVVGGYIRGQLTLALLIGVLVGAGMFILHVPYAVLLGVLAFFMEFIPIVGVLVSGAICAVVALFVGPITAGLVVGYFVIVHVLEGDLIGPRIMGRAVGIHPATALVALVAGTELFGFWGTLFAAPLAGLLQAFVTAGWTEWRGGDPMAAVHAVQTTVTEEAQNKRQDVVAEQRPRSGTDPERSNVPETPAVPDTR